MKTTYLITYIIYDREQIKKSGVVRAKNKLSEWEARSDFKKLIAKNFPGCRLVIDRVDQEEVNDNVFEWAMKNFFK